jgi:hypothetical protein
MFKANISNKIILQIPALGSNIERIRAGDRERIGKRIFDQLKLNKTKIIQQAMQRIASLYYSHFAISVFL